MVDLFEKYKDLSPKEDIYIALKNLIKIRNRIHIQNQKNASPKYGNQLWTVENIKFFGQALKEIFVYLALSYPRLNDIRQSS